MSNNTTSDWAPSSSIVPILVAFGSGIAFAAIAVMFQYFCHRRFEASDTETTIVRELENVCGLSKPAISSLPTFAYKNPDNGIESIDNLCTVCLEPFHEEEMVRQLSRCKHLFHMECIDMWLYSHKTCPVCRAVVVLAEVRKKKPIFVEVDPPMLPV